MKHFNSGSSCSSSLSLAFLQHFSIQISFQVLLLLFFLYCNTQSKSTLLSRANFTLSFLMSNTGDRSGFSPSSYGSPALSHHLSPSPPSYSPASPSQFSAAGLSQWTDEEIKLLEEALQTYVTHKTSFLSSSCVNTEHTKLIF